MPVDFQVAIEDHYQTLAYNLGWVITVKGFWFADCLDQIANSKGNNVKDRVV